MYIWNFNDRAVADSFISGLKKAGALDPGPDYIYVSKEDQVTGDDLKALFFPSTTTGFARNGALWSQENSKEGRAIIHAPFVRGGMDTGRIWIEGDKIWQQFEQLSYGMPYCGVVFKNPKGTPEEKNEYIAFEDLYPSIFSRLK
jgi:hypothetical protein